MRSYPANSPQATARIVTLTMVVDDDIGDAEIEWLNRLAVHEQLGLARHALHALLGTFCEDLLSSDQLKSRRTIWRSRIILKHSGRAHHQRTVLTAKCPQIRRKIEPMALAIASDPELRALLN